MIWPRRTTSFRLPAVALLLVLASCIPDGSPTSPGDAAPPGPPPLTASDAAPGTQITHTLLTAGNKTVNRKVYTTAAIAPAPNTLITVAVMGHRAYGASPIPTLSGGGMTTWTEVASVTFDPLGTPLKRVTIYRAMSPSPGSGPLTITFSATQGNCQWIVSQWAGADLSGVNGAGAIGQTGSNRGNAVSGLAIPLAAFGNADNVAYGVFGVRSKVLAVTPGAGFTEIAEQPSAESTPSDLEAEWKTNDNTIDASWTSRNAGALGVEIKAAATVTPVPVATVEVSPAAPSVQVGQTVQLTATLRDANGTVLSGRTVTWASSNAAVATVNGSALVTGVAAGSATITATSEGVWGTGTLTVTAAPPGTVTDLAVAGVTDASVTLSFTEVNDGTGQPASYDIRGVPGTTLVWGSTAPSVSQGTCATPVAGSTIGATRTCTVLGLSASTTYSFQLVAFGGTLNVNAVFGELSNITTGTTAAPAAAPVASVTVSPGSASVGVGGTQQFAATLRDANGNVLTGRSVTWTSSNPTVATVSSTGLATALVTGTATITATSEGVSGTATLTVTAVPPGTVTDLAVAGVTDASVTLSFTEVNDGTGQPASYDIRGVPGTTLVWGSTAPSVSQGTCATPVAGSTIGATRTCTVLGLSASTTYSFQLVAFGGTLNVNAVFGGLSNITTGTTAAPAAAPVASVTVSPGSASVGVGGTQQFAATLRDANGNVLTGRSVTWTSSDATVATVSSTGLAAALVTGTATITATSEGQSGTAAITVTSADGGPQPGPTDVIIFQDGFESGTLSLWEQIPANGRYSVTTNAARVKSGTRSLETLYTPTNGYGMITKWFMPGYDEVYVKFHVLFEEGFQNLRDDGNGMHFLVVAGNRIDNDRSSFGKASVVPNGTDFFYAGVDPEYVHGDPTLRPFSYYTYWPDMSCCYGNIIPQLSPKVALTSGQWQEVVFHVKLNTPGQYNGSQTLWINGVKKIDMQNMRWRTTTDLRINQLRLDNYMPGAPKTEYIWIDDVTVWRP